MKFFNKKKVISKKGFTLVEALVAISIFTVSILALIAILANSLANVNYAKQKIVGIYLAQEGIEYMRSLRDTYVLYAPSGNNGWNDFISKINSCDLSVGPYGCYFDMERDQNGNVYNIFSTTEQPITNTRVGACSTSSCPGILFDSTTGKYGYLSGVPSGFVRRINTEIVSVKEMRITSTITWQQGSGLKELVLTDTLFNWVQ